MHLLLILAPTFIVGVLAHIERMIKFANKNI